MADNQYLYNTGQLAAWQPPTIPYVIDQGILDAGAKLLLFAPQKSLKSMLAMHMAFCISSGTDWFGYRTLPHVTLYLNYEGSMAGFRRRIMKYKKFRYLHTQPPPDITNWWFFDKKVKLDSSWGQAELERTLYKSNASVLIIDPIYRAMQGGQNDEDSVNRFLNNLDLTAEKYGLSIILLHHTRKTQMSEGTPIDMGTEDAAGMSHFGRWADTVMRIRRTTEDPAKDTIDLVLTVEPSRELEHATYPIVVRFHQRTMKFEWLNQRLEIPADKITARIQDSEMYDLPVELDDIE